MQRLILYYGRSWKLAYVIRGLAAPSILDTLTQERAPVGRAIVKRANTGMLQHRELWALLGLTKQERDAALQQMDDASPAGAAFRQKVRAAMDATDDEVNSPGIQMNQNYCSTDSKLVLKDPADVDPSAEATAHDFLKTVFTTTTPGFHLPHVWLAKDGQSPRISTLDLVGRGYFTLLTGLGGDAWREAVTAVAATGFPIRIHSIGWRQDYQDVYGHWAQVRGVDEASAVLVRPDHFVAWRSRGLPADCIGVLKEVIALLLH